MMKACKIKKCMLYLDNKNSKHEAIKGNVTMPYYSMVAINKQNV